MILTAALAIGFWICRNAGQEVLPDLPALKWPTIDDPSPVMYASFLVMVYTPVIWTLSLALAVCRLGKPRPAWRTVFRQQGAMATFTVSILSLSASPYIIISYIYNYICPGNVTSLSVASIIGGGVMECACAGAIVAVWLISSAGGVRVTEATWVDRAGRAMGFVWVALLPVFMITSTFYLWAA